MSTWTKKYIYPWGETGFMERYVDMSMQIQTGEIFTYYRL